MNKVQVGRVLKVSGFQGEVIIRLDHKLPQLHNETPDFVYLNREGSIVPYRLLFSSLNSTSWKVGLKRIDSEERAKQIISCPVLLPQEFVGDQSPGMTFNPKGYEVTDTRFGLLGEVESVDNRTANPLLIVNQSKGLLYIPLNEEFILQVDHKAKVIEVSCPEELLDLND